MISPFEGRRPAAVTYQASSALIAGLAVAWTFYAMREVMEIGGACADGGPYVSVAPCPDGAWMMALGIPLMMLTVITATIAAISSGTPLPVFPMWAALFTALGANFLDFGFSDPKSAEWIFCGFLFEAMALPAWLIMLGSLRVRKTDAPGAAGLRINWITAYLALGALGWGLGWWTYDAWS